MNKNIFFLLILLSSLLFFSSKIVAETFVSGDITSNVTWTTSGSPYILTSGITIGVTCILDSNDSCTQEFTQDVLTIEPGVEVNLNGFNLATKGGFLNADDVSFTTIANDTAIIDLESYSILGEIYAGGTNINNSRFLADQGQIIIQFSGLENTAAPSLYLTNSTLSVNTLLDLRRGLADIRGNTIDSDILISVDATGSMTGNQLNGNITFNSANFIISGNMIAVDHYNLSGFLHTRRLETVNGISKYQMIDGVHVSVTCPTNTRPCTGIYQPDVLTLEAGITLDLNGHILQTLGGVIDADDVIIISSSGQGMIETSNRLVSEYATYTISGKASIRNSVISNIGDTIVIYSSKTYENNGLNLINNYIKSTHFIMQYLLIIFN